MCIPPTLGEKSYLNTRHSRIAKIWNRAELYGWLSLQGGRNDGDVKISLRIVRCVLSRCFHFFNLGGKSKSFGIVLLNCRTSWLANVPILYCLVNFVNYQCESVRNSVVPYQEAHSVMQFGLGVVLKRLAIRDGRNLVGSASRNAYFVETVYVFHPTGWAGRAMWRRCGPNT